MSAQRLKVLIALALATLFAGPSQAMAPLPRPEVDTTILPGEAAPFVGPWSVTVPTRDATIPDSRLAICALPVRIESADAASIRYFRPGEVATDTVMALAPQGDGTAWTPLETGAHFLALWVTPDQFYLYDVTPGGEPDWAAPYLYRRCP